MRIQTYIQTRFLNRLGIGQTLATLTAFFIVSLCALTSLVYDAHDHIETETTRLNALGYQRYQIQRYMQEVILLSQGLQTNPQTLLNRINTNQQALQNGGQITLDINQYHLPPAPNALQEGLAYQHQTLQKLADTAKRFLQVPPETYKNALKTLQQQAHETHTLANNNTFLAKQSLNAYVDTLWRRIFMLGVLIALLGVGLAYIISQNFKNICQNIRQQTQALANGDLDQPALTTAQNGAIGHIIDALNTLQTTLQTTTEKARLSQERTTRATNDILSATQQQNATIAQQTAAVQQTAGAMREISESGAHIARRADELAAQTEKLDETGQAGLQSVRQTTQAIENIREQAEAVAENIVVLSEKTQAIGNIILSVDNLSQQANLLAVNAAIEATDAQTDGASFGVVADEMQHLAARSKEATIEVRDLLEDIQQGINTSVMLTEEAVKRVETGISQTHITEKTIRTMTEALKDSLQSFREIAKAAGQQQTGIEQITQALQDVEQGTQQTTQGIVHLEKSLQELTQSKDDMQKTMEHTLQ